MWNRHSWLLDTLLKSLPQLSTLRKIRGHVINVQALNRKWTFPRPYFKEIQDFVPSSWYKKVMLWLFRAQTQCKWQKPTSTFCLKIHLKFRCRATARSKGEVSCSCPFHCWLSCWTNKQVCQWQWDSILFFQSAFLGWKLCGLYQHFLCRPVNAFKDNNFNSHESMSILNNAVLCSDIWASLSISTSIIAELTWVDCCDNCLLYTRWLI